jgi:hypothetical protein
MPTPSEILTGLSFIANRYWLVALGFHVAVVALSFAAWRRWRPTTQTVARILVVPLISVAGFAAWAGNPFNAAIFGLLAGALAAETLRMTGSDHTGPAWSKVIGALMVLFGLFYPHFLARGLPLAYLYAAPTGLLPCPTLSLVIGFSLLLGGLRSWTWSGLLAGAGLFYGFFGGFRLGVRIDAFLIAGALALAATMLPRASKRRWASAPLGGQS